MAEPFDSPKRRLARGKSHMEEFKAGINAFGKKKPWTDAVIEPDGDGIHKSLKIKFREWLPDTLGDAVVDGVDNLRAALDQTGFAVATLAGVSESKSAYFPFADSAEQLEIVTKGRCKDLPPEIRTLFCSFKPYKGGNDLLWALNKLCNANKHRVLTPVGAGSSGMSLDLTGAGDGIIVGDVGMDQYASGQWDDAKKELVFIRMGMDTIFRGKGDVSFFIGLGEIDVLMGTPALNLADMFVSEVEKILLATEAECRRINLIQSPG
jgi:hypothetical protein